MCDRSYDCPKYEAEDEGEEEENCDTGEALWQLTASIFSSKSLVNLCMVLGKVSNQSNGCGLDEIRLFQ